MSGMTKHLLSVASLVAVMVAAGCVWDRPVGIPPAGTMHRPDTCVVVMFADGLYRPVFDEMLAAGELPNLRRHLFARGTRVAGAVTVIPSITYPAGVSMITGQLPGHHGITGNRWFDRDTLMLEDYVGPSDYQHVDHQFVAPTLFEMAPDLYSVSVLFAAHRGVTRYWANTISGAVTYVFGTMAELDALTAYRLGEIGTEAAAAGRWPDILWLYFPGPDHIAHQFGPASPQYRAILRNLDVQVGRVADTLTQAGVYDRTLITLISDHGHVPVDPASRVDLIGRLKGYGFAISARELIGGTYLERLKEFGPVRIVVLDDGNRRAVLHLRAGEQWPDRPTLAQIERFHRDFGGPAVRGNPAPFWNVLLSALPPGHVAAIRDGDGRVVLADDLGQSAVERQIEWPPGTRSPAAGSQPGDPAGGVHRPEVLPSGRVRSQSYRYRVLSGRDPLGLDRHPAAGKLIDGQFHSSEAWLQATTDSSAPDLVAQIVDYFDSRRSGDLLIFSTGPWQFAAGTLGGHGSITPMDMRIVWAFAGPTIPAGGSIPFGRLVDLTPTLLDFLGRLDHRAQLDSLDGVSRLPELRSARPGR
jgi:hypothetical protein